jgi:hypothetical protein
MQLKMEPHGQSPRFPRNAHKGRTSRTRGPIHPRVEPVVLLVRDRSRIVLNSAKIRPREEVAFIHGIL